MLINISKKDSRVPVTLMQLTGDLDASNYTEVIAKAQEVYEDGTRDLLIDLSKVPYVSSAGLMALHAVVLIFSGQSMQPKTGRPTFQSINPQRDSAVREHVKLLSPQAAVEKVLDVVGLKHFFELYTELETALQSF